MKRGFVSHWNYDVNNGLYSIKFDENQKLKRDKILDFFISLLFGIFWPIATIIGVIVLIFDKSKNNSEVEK